MVTAEAALVIPVLLAVTLTLSWAISIGASQVKLIDAAREGARLAARGESGETVRSAIERTAPAGASGTVDASGEMVTVRVEAQVRPDVPLLGALPGVSLASEATAASEETQ